MGTMSWPPLLPLTICLDALKPQPNGMVFKDRVCLHSEDIRIELRVEPDQPLSATITDADGGKLVLSSKQTMRLIVEMEKLAHLKRKVIRL